MKPKLLDLFCGAGGAAMGYHRAGFEVVGVDIKPQKNYPFEFHQADALTFPLDGFDVIHASPPCQRYSSATRMTAGRKDDHPDLLGKTRDALISSGKLWAIENVMGAPFHYYIKLCGTMFGLKTYRHRGFETSILILNPFQSRCLHKEKLSHNGWGASENGFCGCSGNQKFAGHFELAKKSMGIDWMTWKELTQAVPPAYTNFIGVKLIEYLDKY